MLGEVIDDGVAVVVGRDVGDKKVIPALEVCDGLGRDDQTDVMPIFDEPSNSLNHLVRKVGVDDR